MIFQLIYTNNHIDSVFIFHSNTRLTSIYLLPNLTMSQDEQLNFQLLDSQNPSDQELLNFSQYDNASSTNTHILQVPKRKRKRTRIAKIVKCVCGQQFKTKYALTHHIKNTKAPGHFPAQRGVPLRLEQQYAIFMDQAQKRSLMSDSYGQKSQYQESQYDSKQVKFGKKTDQTSKRKNQKIIIQDHQNLSILTAQNHQEDQKAYSVQNTQKNKGGFSDFESFTRFTAQYYRKPKYGRHGTVRKYVSKRVFFCGGCSKKFNFLEQLVLHIKKSYKGNIPDGTIFGYSKSSLFSRFNIKARKPQPLLIPKRAGGSNLRCGCGKEYGCSSALYYHIKTVHNLCIFYQGKYQIDIICINDIFK